MTAPNPAASFPVPATTEQFRMGPLLTEAPAVDFWWNTQLGDGTYTAADEPEGWESIEYILPLDQVGGRDGAFTGPESVAPRVLEIKALIVAPNGQVLRDNCQKIRRILGPQGLPGPRQPVVWEQYDWRTGVRQAFVTRPQGGLRIRAIGGAHPGGEAAEISFQLVAANPVWKYQSGAIEFAEVGLLDTGLVEGRTYYKTFDYTYGSGGSPGGQLIAINNGDLPAWPVFTVRGEADAPIITNATTGQDWQIDTNLVSMQIVTVNSRTGVVTPGSVRLLGRPFALQPGANTITWRTASGAFHPEALLRLEWRSTSS